MSVMANQTTDYHGDVYQWNRTAPTDDRDTQTEYYLPNWTDLVLAALFCMLIVVTIVGNTLVIAAVITTRRLRSVTNCFVSSLAAADLLVGLAVMPPAVLLQLNGGSWELGKILCDSWVSLDILLCTASILSLCAISIDRYLAVTQPLVYSRRRRSKRLAGLMIVAVWILAGAITSPPLLGSFPRATNRDSKKCSYNMDSSYVIFSACGSFFLPMLVMLYVYGRISCVIASRHRNLETGDAGGKTRRKTRHAPTVLFRMEPKSQDSIVRTSIIQNADYQNIERTKSTKVRRAECGVDGDTCERTSNEGEQTSGCKKAGIVRGHQQSCINRVARETKTAGTLAVVVGGFVACWLPFFILYLATPFIPVEPPDILMPALTWLGWINSAINPFIYAFYSADFRLAFWRLTCRKCFKSQTTLNHTERKLPTPAKWRKDASRT